MNPLGNRIYGHVAAQPGQIVRRATTSPMIPKPPQPPKWVVELMAKAKPGDRGLGDVIAREIGWKGDPKFEAWFKANLRKPCKGYWSLEMVNAKWPLSIV
jgi:hypothetical protein